MKTFADAAARYAYYVQPEDVRTEFKQLDTNEVYVASRQGAGAQAWELSYEVGGGGLEDGDYGDIIVSSTGTRLFLRGLAIGSGIETPTIGTDQNNYPVAANTSVIAVIPTATFTFTGFDEANDTQGRMVLLQNAGEDGFPFFIAHRSASSNAFFCRVNLTNAQRLVVRQGEGVWLRLTGVYWQPVSIVHGDGQQTLTDDATVTFDVSLARNATVTLTASRALSFTNLTSGDRGLLRVIQDGAGGWQFTSITGLAGDAAHIPGGAAALPTLLNGTASTSDLLGWEYDGTNLLVWNEGEAFASSSGA